VNLKNNVVLISGAAGRIGLACTELVLKSGGKVILGDVNIKPLKGLLTKYKNNLILKRMDVNQTKNLDKLINLGLKKFGKITSSVHCSYPLLKSVAKKKFEQKTLQDISRRMSNELGGSIIFSQRMLRTFVKQKKGNIILISSIMGSNAPKFEHYTGTNMSSSIEYHAIKAGVISITKYLAKYCKNKNIRVNCISPGGIKDNQPKSFQKKYRRSCNTKGLLDAKDLKSTLFYLLSDDTQYLTGQNIIIDDGWSL